MCTQTSATHLILCEHVPHLPHLFPFPLQVRYLLYTSYQKVGDMLKGSASSGEVRGGKARGGKGRGQRAIGEVMVMTIMRSWYFTHHIRRSATWSGAELPAGR